MKKLNVCSKMGAFFVFLPKERAKVWGYGIDKIADEIKKRPGTNFVIDQSRIKPTYMNLAFFLQYPPDIYQAALAQVIKRELSPWRAVEELILGAGL